MPFFFRSATQHTILVSDRLSDSDAGLIVRVVQTQGLCDLDPEPGSSRNQLQLNGISRQSYRAHTPVGHEVG